MTIIKEGPWAGFELVSVYTRAQAIADGVLIPCDEAARLAGIHVPCVVTEGVWAHIEKPFSAQELEEGVLPFNRLVQLIQALRVASSKINDKTDRVEFTDHGEELYALCHGDDEGKACITIMLIGED